MLRDKLIYGILIVGSIATYIWTNKKESLIFFLFGIIIFIVLKLSVIWGTIGLKLTIAMELSGYVGRESAIHLRLTRVFPIGLGRVKVRFYCYNKMFNEEIEQELYLVPNRKKEIDFELPFTFTCCGQYKFRFDSICSYDLLGITKKKSQIDLEESLIVYPKDMHIQANLVDRNRSNPQGEIFDRPRKGYDVNEIFGLRDYKAGDSVKSIHWKLSSKLDHLIIREFGNPSNYEILILFDAVFMDKEKKVSTAVLDGVFSTVISVSENLWQKGIGHQVGGLLEGDFLYQTVDTALSFEKMQEELLNFQIASGETDGIAALIKEGYHQLFSKIVCISCRFDEEKIRQLSMFTDLTLIQVQEGIGEGMEMAKGYEIIRIDVALEDEHVRFINV